MEEQEKKEEQEKQEIQNKKNTQQIVDKVNEQIEEKIKKIVEVGVQSDNVDYLYKLVDIHKDLANEDYWKCKKEVMKMRYRDGYGRDEYGAEEYGNYGRRMRDSRGRYMDRGQEMLDDMRDMYGEYSDSKEEYGRGNYRAKDDTMKSLDYMLQSVMEFMKKLQQEADSPEEVELVKKYARKIGMM